MRKTLRELAQLVGGEVVGDENIVITGASGIKEACQGDITFLANPKYSPLLTTTGASAVITSRDASSPTKAIIRVENPSLAFAKVISLIAPDDIKHPKGIHPTAVLGKNVKLGCDVALGPYVVVDDDVWIGDKTIIYSGSFIGKSSKIGDSVLIYPNVSIRERITIGNRVIIHSGAVIGSDGFGFVTAENKHYKIPQVGVVEICDDVEIGANVTIDRARFDKTVVGKGTKIDNLVHIAHNVIIQENCFIVAQVGISGSTVIGNNVILAGQAGLVGHITIGDNAVVTAQSGVSKSVPANTMVSGYPARPFMTSQRINACIQNLPKLFNLVKELKNKIEELQAKLAEKVKNG
ncbi:MAG: UDP-3-O-(3-hydroxymyristoyl)glucosamine N-acyltransferase [Candidatus Omnitrophica bacterium]|nr:UDP-3-O-(3-hydroxymyristoyl)glucosamine N-acyltransferase [Candidatus Omnitrophota bacterium]